MHVRSEGKNEYKKWIDDERVKFRNVLILPSKEKWLMLRYFMTWQIGVEYKCLPIHIYDV